MPGICDMRVLARLLFLSCLMLAAPSSWAADSDAVSQQVQRQQDQPLNNAPVWREVRKGDNAYQTSQVRGIESTVLVQSQGDTWRRIRNGPVTVYGGWLFVLAFFGALLFYWWRGPIKLKGQRTGRMIERFTPFERVLHWTTAISFVVLASSGIVLLFGKYVVLPLFG